MRDKGTEQPEFSERLKKKLKNNPNALKDFAKKARRVNSLRKRHAPEALAGHLVQAREKIRRLTETNESLREGGSSLVHTLENRGRATRVLLDWEKADKERTKETAFVDSLTKVLNRTGLGEKLLSYGEMPEVASVMMVDIDTFKAVNDAHGHDVGDLVIKKLAETLTQLAQELPQGKKVLVCRWGGEEFVVVFFGSSPEEIIKLLEQKQPGPKEKNQPPTLDVEVSFDAGENKETKTIHCTVSGGIKRVGQTNGPVNLEALNEDIKQADKLLYKAKRNGRAQILT
jgi:diguanylate cyclase (GGDEF)-like protein